MYLCQLLRRPASFNTGQPRGVSTVSVRRISSDDVQHPDVPPQILRPSNSEPLIPADPSTRRRVARDPSANPSPPAGRRSSSSSPAERGPSPGRSAVTRGPSRQRQPPPSLALPPPAGGRRAGPTAERSGKTDRQRRGMAV